MSKTCSEEKKFAHNFPTTLDCCNVANFPSFPCCLLMIYKYLEGSCERKAPCRHLAILIVSNLLTIHFAVVSVNVFAIQYFFIFTRCFSFLSEDFLEEWIFLSLSLTTTWWPSDGPSFWSPTSIAWTIRWFMCEKKTFSFRKKDGENFAKENPCAHLKINLTSLQHDFLHLNDMWRKFLFSFWLLLEKENSREKGGKTRARWRRKRYKCLINLTSKNDAHRLTVDSWDRYCSVGRSTIGSQAGIFWLRGTHRSFIKSGNCKEKNKKIYQNLLTWMKK